MAVLQVKNLTKSFGEKTIFHGVSFQLDFGEKAALVGVNGAGKSTLLRCIMGLEDYDAGSIMADKNVRISYLAQSMEEESLDLSLWEFMLDEYRDLLGLRVKLKNLTSKMAQEEIYSNELELARVMKSYTTAINQYEANGGYSFESKIKEVLFGLGFMEAELERSMDTFSGGQKTRLYLARQLLRQPELLLLDEPTNFLDLQAVEWLENFLKSYKASVLVVSHDRYFLDSVATKIFELEDEAINTYPGNYSDFMLQKAIITAAQSKEYAKEQEKIKRLEEYIRRNKAGVNARQAKGREKQLSKLGQKTKPSQQKSLSFSFQQSYASGEDVLIFKNASIGYPGKILIEKLNFKLRRGERVGFIGPNGSGKSTLLKAILSQETCRGTVYLGSGVKIGYFAQEHESLNSQGTVLEQILQNSLLTDQAARDLLARFQFKGDDIFKEISSLSGGEESRLMLAELFLQGANFLILDEPTNHLDVYTRQSLEDALADFPGTLLFVSHDRYFLNRLADKIIELEQGTLLEYPGDYEYYHWKKSLTPAVQEAQPEKQKVKTKETKVRKNPKPEVQLKKLEEEISELEQALEEITQKLGDSEIYTQPDAMLELQQEYQEVEEKLNNLYIAWEEVAEAVEEKGE
ncbi:ABC-F family ATP-binding cassette domain-containing protein [Bacillota bacterium LX-D]|nr:ABC-F family ATP-binding cassette domain-containing protein [Bacillota bacterium LX-D]